jgi:hypothetical protein
MKAPFFDREIRNSFKARANALPRLSLGCVGLIHL